MSITAQDVKALRDRTGAGHDGVQEGPRGGRRRHREGDRGAAREGRAKAEKRGEREAAEGTVQSYIHSNGKIGVLVEVDCETDFVARNEDFVAFARDLALHVAAAAPGRGRRGRRPRGRRARDAHRRGAVRRQAGEHPAEHRQREGRAWLKEVVLLNQAHVNGEKYDGRTIEQIRAELAAKTGENIVIRRFTRFAVGD